MKGALLASFGLLFSTIGGFCKVLPGACRLLQIGHPCHTRKIRGKSIPDRAGQGSITGGFPAGYRMVQVAQRHKVPPGSWALFLCISGMCFTLMSTPQASWACEAFADVLASNETFSAPMEETYKLLDLNPADTTTLEDFLQESYTSILKKLNQVGASSRQTDFYV
ncbi:Uncharacterized protein ycf39 at C-terminar half [Coccomyxa sp. Obi]|nr:Uncharacterized protein ycf39 at C-terminar half [Coccomyxa sp. Obi]